MRHALTCEGHTCQYLWHSPILKYNRTVRNQRVQLLNIIGLSSKYWQLRPQLVLSMHVPSTTGPYGKHNSCTDWINHSFFRYPKNSKSMSHSSHQSLQNSEMVQYFQERNLPSCYFLACMYITLVETSYIKHPASPEISWNPDFFLNCNQTKFSFWTSAVLATMKS